MHYRFLRFEDPFPLVAGELALEMDHWAERGAALQLRGNPSIPVGDRRDGTVKVHLVHLLWDLLGVCPVPKEAALLDYHVGGCC
jgi:hypothetical protein